MSLRVQWPGSVYRAIAALVLVGLATIIPVAAVAAGPRTTPLRVTLPVVAQYHAPAAVVPAQASAAASVSIVNFDYRPTSLTVEVGTTVNWTNTSNRPHTVTDRGGTFDSQAILPGHVASVTLTAPGTYFYFCRVNPSKMNGTIVVTPGAQPSKAVRVQAVDPTNIVGESFRFDPNALTVAAGTTVLVANVGGKPHTLTADDGSFTTGLIAPGAEGGRFAGINAVLTLNEPGSHPFHCEIHPGVMKGSITVTGSPPDNPPPPASNAAQRGTIKAVDFSFDPTQLVVAPSAKLTVDNGGKAPHTVTFDDVSLDTGIIQPGASGQLAAPAKPGSYSYHCNVHPDKMRGVLVVLGQDEADPTGIGKAPAKPLVAALGGGPGGRVSTVVLVTGVLGAFLGGLGLASFLGWRRSRETKSTVAPSA